MEAQSARSNLKPINVFDIKYTRFEWKHLKQNGKKNSIGINNNITLHI